MSIRAILLQKQHYNANVLLCTSIIITWINPNINSYQSTIMCLWAITPNTMLHSWHRSINIERINPNTNVAIVCRSLGTLFSQCTATITINFRCWINSGCSSLLDAWYACQFEAVFLFSCPDCPSCPANAIQMVQATWATINKYVKSITVVIRQVIQCSQITVQIRQFRQVIKKYNQITVHSADQAIQAGNK